MKILLLITAFIWAGVASAADIYRWVDADGTIRYSDLIPPPSAKDVQKFKSNAVTLKEENAPSALPPETKAAAEKLPVTLFSFEECGAPCKNAEDLLNKRGIPYTLKNDDAGKIELRKLTGKLVAPAMVIGNTDPIVSFNEDRWNKELDMAGYAKSNPSAKPGSNMAIKQDGKAASNPPEENPAK